MNAPQSKIDGSGVWFRLGTANDGGRHYRVWEIQCKECKRIYQFEPKTASDEKLRKRQIASGWTMGRKWDQHVCPQCVDVSKIKAKPMPEPPPPVPFLIEAWEASTPEEQAALKQRLFKEGQLQAPMRQRTLTEQWEAADHDKRMATVLATEEPGEIILALLPRVSAVFKQRLIEGAVEAGWRIWRPDVSLRQMWEQSNATEQHGFLQWLEQARKLPRQAIAQAWHAATQEQQLSFLTAFFTAPKFDKPSFVSWLRQIGVLEPEFTMPFPTADRMPPPPPRPTTKPTLAVVKPTDADDAEVFSMDDIAAASARLFGGNK